MQPHNHVHLDHNNETRTQTKIEAHIYLAGAALDDNKAVLTDGPSLLRVGIGLPCISLRLDVVLI